ncbi:MAG: glycosyltransferase family 2 protein, partial [Acidobacteria bacterium]
MNDRPAPAVSIVIPAFNERECLPVVLDEIAQAMDGRSYEVVVVDDGSTDGTGEWLDARAARDPHLVVLHLVRNAGQSAAFHAGFHRARAPIVVTLDADGQ